MMQGIREIHGTSIVTLGPNLRHWGYFSIFVEAVQSHLGPLRHCGGGNSDQTSQPWEYLGDLTIGGLV